MNKYVDLSGVINYYYFMKLLKPYKYLFVLPAFLVFSVLVSKAQNLIPNGDFTDTHIVDNTWDGVNREGYLVTHTHHSLVLISGSRSQGKPFGASPCWKDVTGDGKPDLVVGDGNGFIWIFETRSRRNAYPPVFTTGRFVHAFYGDDMNIDVCDINADRINDILIGLGNGQIRLLRNNGGGKFLPTATGQPLTEPMFERGEKARYLGRYLAPRLVDWNNDKKIDLIFGEGSYSANSIYLYLNQGNNSNPEYGPARRHWLAYGMGREHLSPAVGDLDADGDLDLLVGERIGNLTWYENIRRDPDSETPYLLQPKDYAVTVGAKEKPAGEFPRPYLADIDGDKKLDLIIGCNDGRLMFSRNIGVPVEPAFAEAVYLKGKDTLKPYPTPSRWSLHRGRTSAIVMQAKKEMDLVTGKQLAYAHLYFVDGYVGASGGLGTGCSIDYDKTYRLTFRARAKNTRGGCSISQSAERYVEGEFLRSRGGETVRMNVSPGTDWQTFTKTFRFSRLTKEAEKRTSTGVHIGFGMSGAQPNSWFDITDVTVVPANEPF